VLLLAAGLVGMPSGIVAQQAPAGVMAPAETMPPAGTPRALLPPGSEPRTFGTSSPIAHTIQAFQFHPIAGGGTFTGSALNGALACTAQPCTFVAPLLLPAGALLTSIELEACDTDAMDDLFLTLYRITNPPGGIDNLASTSTNGAPGCTRVTQVLATPEKIDNLIRSYAIEVVSGVAVPPLPVTTRFFAVRVFYSLQVSPAPVVATFSDVPTSHPFFRFIEALARSGITSGCGAGNFCPDSPLTRGQMAVFLSLGLGLHSAP
jgi:hypothetical protein